MNRTRRSAWNYLSSVFFVGISLGAAFVSTPFLLRWLGEERFGAYRVASDWGGYVALLELGLGGTLLALLSQGVGRPQAAETVRATLAAGIRTYFRLTVVAAAASVALALLMPSLVPVSASLRGDLVRGCWLAILVNLWLPFAPFRYLAEASQRGYVVNVLLFVQRLWMTALALLFAWRGWGITGQFAALVVGFAPFHLVMAWDGLRRYPGVGRRVLAGPANPAARAALRKLTWPTFVFNLCGQLSLLTDNIIIGFFLGPAAVVPFVITQRLPALVQGQITGIGNASWAGLVELHVQGKYETFNRRLIDLTGLVMALGLSCMVPMVAYNRQFVTLWVGADHFGGEWLTLLTAVNGLLLGVISLWGWPLAGTGNIACMLPMTTTWAALNLTISIAATRWFGLIGPLVGTLTSYLAVSLWWLAFLLRQTFGTELRPLFLGLIRPLLIGLPYGCGVWWLARAHPPGGWPELVTEMASAALVFLPLWWWLCLDGEQRASWGARLRLIFRGTPVPQPPAELLYGRSLQAAVGSLPAEGK